MKTSAEKSSATTSKTATQSAHKPFFAKAGGGDFFAPAVQMKMAVNKPGDKFEQEADKMADKVMRMPAPATGKDEKLQRAPEEKLQKKEQDKIQKAAAPEEKIQKAPQPEEKLQKKEDEKLQKAPAQEEKLQRKGGDGAPAVTSNVQSAIHNKTTGGQPMSADVRSFMEPRFNADFSNVRVHSDPESAGLSNQLSARAFTYQNHVFFSHDQYQPGTSEGKQLLAHELTHTIQQGHAVQRSPQVSTTTTPPAVQRFLGIDIPSWQDVLDWLAEKAYNIPGYRMFTIVIGVNPINGESADRSAANILRAIVEFLPGGKIITDALEKYGVFEKAGSWVEGQLKRFANLLGNVKSAVSQFMDDIDFLDVILHPVRTWERAVDIFTTPVNEIIDFIGSIFQAILQFVRDAVLMPLAALAQGKPGFDLLCAILGKNPITNEPVPRNADTLIGGFMKLIGQEEIWENIKKGNAVQKAWQWFETALQELFAMVVQFPQDFIAMLKSLEVMDFIILPNLFIKIFKVFGSFVVKFYSWAFGTILSLLEIIFSVVAPGVMPYIAKAKASFAKIIKDPIGFVGNLVKAGKMGFNLFMSRIGEHLKTALIKWITGPLGEAGVYIPKSFELMEIVKLVLSVLGLTWQNIRAKLVKIIPDPVLAGLEKTAGILVTLVKDGPAAAWDQIKAELNELKGQLIAQVTQMVTTEIVKAAITKLVMMLNPAGAFVQAVLAIWNTVTFFIQKIKQIGAAAAAFIDSIAAIAAGQIAGAAQKVETTMANTLTLVIAFLAKFAGLGSIPEKIVGIVKKIRAPIDKGLDKIVGWLGNLLKKAGGAITQAGLPTDPEERLKLGVQAALAIVNRFEGKKVGKLAITPLLGAVKIRYGFSSLDLIAQDGIWWISGKINPVTKKPSKHVKVGDGSEVIEEGKLLKKMPQMEITFNVKTKGKKGKEGLDFDEFSRQLSLQQNGINVMTIQTWITNKTNFKPLDGSPGTRDTKGDSDIKRLKSSFEKQLNGEPLMPKPSGLDQDGERLYSLMELAQAELQRMKIAAVTKNPELAKPENHEKLIEEVRKVFKASTGLHRVDQIAGGSGRDIAGLGSDREDFSIGAAWAQAGKNYMSRVETIHDNIEKMVDNSVFPTENMNLKLTPKKT